ncbi:uncharacterized protein LOC133343369 [Lethenteron reissneri]|uniref:uncharacterized protein LOC133343369 n=1 Tax=Lethenteron reissneri TaxID=7753 RepID=UPI002AB68969|nr:uncharacterized protein LOC133343369 [Lethenteron reissneri]
MSVPLARPVRCCRLRDALRVILWVTCCGYTGAQTYVAEVNMAGVRGSVTFDSTLTSVKLNISGMGSEIRRLSVHTYPVLYGHSTNPCSQQLVGEILHNISIGSNDGATTVSAPELFTSVRILADHSLLLSRDGETNSRVCATIQNAQGPVLTAQAKFFGPVAGVAYLRQVDGQELRIITDLLSLGQTNMKAVSMHLVNIASEVQVMQCAAVNPASSIQLGSVTVGASTLSVKSHVVVNLPFSGVIGRMLVIKASVQSCAKIIPLSLKTAKAQVNMNGVKGDFVFQQSSMFELTQVRVSLQNLRGMAGPYHVHNFPVPQRYVATESLCIDPNVGGHWNPFNLDVRGLDYPKFPNGTHDQYEIGDLSGRHGSLLGNTVDIAYMDWNLPLFGPNSIVGRSMVIHHPNTSRWLCASIEPEEEFVTAMALFRFPVVGRVLLRQLKNDPYSDVYIFVEIANGNVSLPSTSNHNWHVHEFPISFVTDLDAHMCSSTGGHFNPHGVNTSQSIYSAECRPDNPYRCEAGDYAGKHGKIFISNTLGTVKSKYFFTDTTSSLVGSNSILGHSFVIHDPDAGLGRLACANITLLRAVTIRTGEWRGGGTVQGQMVFTQPSDLDSTSVLVQFSNLQKAVSGLHVHILSMPRSLPPSDPAVCADRAVRGHFNPFSVDVVVGPAPGNGTPDQYEVGDISGKFGPLRDLDQREGNYSDTNLPLSGINSIAGRSVVIHRNNGSRLQCADLGREKPAEAEWLRARVSFSDKINGTILLSQLVYPDGSGSDTTIEVDLQYDNPKAQGYRWQVHNDSEAVSSSRARCSWLGVLYNPYNVYSGEGEGRSCDTSRPFHCEMGDLTSKQGPLPLGSRIVFNEANLPLGGDATVVGRSLAVWDGTPVGAILDCGTIAPADGAASATLSFPRGVVYSRYELRQTIASALNIAVWRVSLLPDTSSLLRVSSPCQNITFLVAGDVDLRLLEAISFSNDLGKFSATKRCQGNGAGGAVGSTGVQPLTIIIVTLVAMIIQ